MIILITGIDEDTLKASGVEELSVAKRMSWAAKRVTTRIEDIAYCLLGISGVNLPLLYGEGERAFIRLQEEIMRSSDDQSLFAWEDKSSEAVVESDNGPKICLSSEHDGESEVLVNAISTHSPRPLRGFLARTPAEFQHSRNIIPYRNWDVSMPYSMTNQGLRIQFSVLKYAGYKEFIGILACHYENNFLGPLGVYIQPVASFGGDQSARDSSFQKPVLVVPEHVYKAIPRTLYIRQNVLRPVARDLDRRNHFLFRRLPDDWVLTRALPAENWNEAQQILRPRNRIGAIYLKSSNDNYGAGWLSFAVIVRSDIVPDNPKLGGPNYSCNIVAGPLVRDEEYLDKVLESTSPEPLQSVSRVLINAENGIQVRAFANIDREVFMASQCL